MIDDSRAAGVRPYPPFVGITHDEAVCLRHRDWSETSQTVILLTRSHGLLNGLAKGSKRERAAFSGGFELLQRGQVGFIRRPDKDLLTLTEWDLLEAHAGLRSRYRPAVLAMFAAEMTASLLAPGDPHPRAFEAMCGMLSASASSGCVGAGPDCEPFTRYMVSLLDEAGHLPDLRPGAGVGGGVLLFDPARGRFVEPSAGRVPASDPFGVSGDGEVWPIRAETAGLLMRVVRGIIGAGEAEAGVVWVRACRFLAAWGVYRSGRRPSSLSSFLRITRD